MNADDDSLNGLRKAIAASGLGPATVESIRDGEAVTVTLETAAPDKAATLLRWVADGPIEVIDMVAGQYRKSDPEYRLNVRGQFDSGLLVVVIAPFRTRGEPQQVELIRSSIKRQCPRELITRLAEIERGR